MDHSQGTSQNIVITAPDDCNNAPRKNVLKEVTVAYVQNNLDYLSKMMADDVVWHIVGDKRIDGKEQLLENVQQSYRDIKQLQIDKIITHGTTAALNGLITRNDGTEYAYCDVYVFSGGSKSAKIKEITSYIIKTSLP